MGIKFAAILLFLGHLRLFVVFTVRNNAAVNNLVCVFWSQRYAFLYTPRSSSAKSHVLLKDTLRDIKIFKSLFEQKLIQMGKVFYRKEVEAKLI